MRLLHVAPFFEPAWERGGMARAAAALARALAARGHEVTVLTSCGPGAPREEQQGAVRVVRLASPPLLDRLLVPWAPGAGARLRELAAHADAGHVHGHRSGLAVAAASAFAAAGLPYVLETHGTYPDHGQRVPAKRLFDLVAGGAVVRRAAALVAKSAAEARQLPRPAVVVPNGVEVPAAPVVPEAERRNRLLFVGNDRPQKRGRRLAGLLEALPEARLDVAGPVGPSFRAAFRAFGDRVRFLGPLDPARLAAAYAAAAVVVHPAVGEAFGLVPFEAALCGTAAVVAGDHGCGEWFGAAGGAWVPPDDAASLLAAVQERLSDPSRARTEAAAVAAYAARNLTWPRAAEGVEAVYASFSS
jgi:glycosyltransferase involved in cell wall biosynthesis